MGLAVGKYIDHLTKTLPQTLRSTLASKTKTWENPGVSHALADLSANIEAILGGREPHYKLGGYEDIPPEKRSQRAFNESLDKAANSLMRGIAALAKTDVKIASARIKNVIAYLKDESQDPESYWHLKQFQSKKPLEAARYTLHEILETNIGSELQQDNPGLEIPKNSGFVEKARRSWDKIRVR